MRPEGAFSRFSTIYITLDGRQFRGQIITPSSDTERTEYSQLRLITGMDSVVKTKDLFYDKQRLVYLIADNDGQSVGVFSSARLFRLFRQDQQLPWTRRSAIVDPLTGMERSGATSQAMGTIWCILLTPTQSEDMLMIPGTKAKIITSADLKEGDNVGKWTITFVDKMLGVTYAEVK